MSNTKRLQILLAGLALSLACSIPSYAEEAATKETKPSAPPSAPPFKRPGGAPMMGDPFEQLGLNEEQKVKLDALREAQGQRDQAIRPRFMEATKKMQELMMEDVVDAGKVSKAFDELTEVRKEQLMSMIEFRNSISEVLTKEQKDKLMAMPPPGARGQGPANRPPMPTQPK